MNRELPESWRRVLGGELEKPYFSALETFVDAERRDHRVFPPDDEVFSAFWLTPYEDVRVLLLGQDPYHDEGQAHGLCFSVRKGQRLPPSLVNVYRELASDLGVTPPAHGHLEAWAKQGVLMLNAVLTVRAHEAASHQGKGWESFTDAVIRKVAELPRPVVFVLWGAYARKKAKLIADARHVVLESAHPSPLSARNGFFGSKVFSRVNDALTRAGRGAIDWTL